MAGTLDGPMAALAAAILFVASVVHMYWALGGKLGFVAAVPHTARGPVFRPTAAAYLLVSLALALAADLMLARIGLVTARIPAWGLHIVCAALAFAFLARAVGDFRFVGFFKREKGSLFARLDTRFYSPLCLFLAAAIGANSF